MEQWIKWIPVKGLNKQYSIKSIKDGYDGFEVILYQPDLSKKFVRVFFEYSPDSYKKTKKRYCEATLNYLKQHYGESFYSQWTFFKVEKSNYVQWLRAGSLQIDADRPFIHFVFVTSNAILDVANVGEPEVTLINLPEHTIS